MIEVADTMDLYLSMFERFEKQRGRGAWLLPIRKAAISRFAELGFPTTADEEWRYTNVGPIAGTAFEPAPEGAFSAEQLRRFLFGGGHAAPGPIHAEQRGHDRGNRGKSRLRRGAVAGHERRRARGGFAGNHKVDLARRNVEKLRAALDAGGVHHRQGHAAKRGRQRLRNRLGNRRAEIHAVERSD